MCGIVSNVEVNDFIEQAKDGAHGQGMKRGFSSKKVGGLVDEEPNILVTESKNLFKGRGEIYDSVI